MLQKPGYPPDAMPTPQETVEAFLRALETMDFAGVEALLHDEVVYQNVPLPADRGKPAVVRTLQRFTKLVSHFEARTVNIAANGPIVLTERVDVLVGPLVHVEIWVCGTFEVRDGKIVLWRDYFDSTQAVGNLLFGKVKRALLGLSF